MHCNLRQPDAAQSLSALIRPLCQVWSRSAYPLPSYSVFPADKLRYAVTLNFDPVTLAYDFWPWTYVADRLRHGQTLYKIWAKSNNPRRSYCSLNIWPYDLEHVSRVALCFEIVCTKFKLSQAIPYEMWRFLMLIRITSYHAMTCNIIRQPDVSRDYIKLYCCTFFLISFFCKNTAFSSRAECRHKMCIRSSVLGKAPTITQKARPPLP